MVPMAMVKPTTEPTNERTPTPTMGPAQGPGIEYKISTNDQLSEADKALINSRVVKSTTDALHITKGGLVAAPRTMSATKVPAKSSHNGNACTDCGSFTLKRNGSCFVCDTCGTTTGCS